ncbi:MAG: hypothetical protein NC910_03400 [Candidatus Omnitrophica bacterium]|nr:hypothetical protein [Candidatus Omnitrophota bacterium]
MPLWTVREWFDLSGKAAKSWMAGKKQEALYYWLQRHFYRGMIAGCFGDWLRRKPVEAISRAGKVS